MGPRQRYCCRPKRASKADQGKRMTQAQALRARRRRRAARGDEGEEGGGTRDASMAAPPPLLVLLGSWSRSGDEPPPPDRRRAYLDDEPREDPAERLRLPLAIGGGVVMAIGFLPLKKPKNNSC